MVVVVVVVFVIELTVTTSLSIAHVAYDHRRSYATCMMAHECQPASKDQAHDTDSTTTSHYLFHDDTTPGVVVVSVWCAWSLDEGLHLWAAIVFLHIRPDFRLLPSLDSTSVRT